MALGGVVTLVVLLSWGYRAAAARAPLPWSLRGRNPGLIEVIARAALAPRQVLCLVRVGPRLVLLGVTPGSLRTLDVISDGDLVAQLLGQAARQRPDSSTAEFARCLETAARGYAPEGEQHDESATPDEGHLLAVRARLTETIRKLRTTAAGV